MDIPYLLSRDTPRDQYTSCTVSRTYRRGLVARVRCAVVERVFVHDRRPTANAPDDAIDTTPDAPQPA
jgi:hypothetical protein